MLALYLFCLVVGGGLLLFAMLGGGEESTVVDSDADLSETLAHDFFSVRALSYLVAGFGATGLLLSVLTDAAAPIAAAWALAVGLTAASASALAYRWLRQSESGLMARTSDHLVGLAARVVLPVTRVHRGKVAAVVAGREVELIARLFEGSDPDCPRGSTVVIVDMAGDEALVAPAPMLPS
jgi:hypothetical protein